MNTFQEWRSDGLNLSHGWVFQPSTCTLTNANENVSHINGQCSRLSEWNSCLKAVFNALLQTRKCLSQLRLAVCHIFAGASWLVRLELGIAIAIAFANVIVIVSCFWLSIYIASVSIKHITLNNSQLSSHESLDGTAADIRYESYSGSGSGSVCGSRSWFVLSNR